LPDSLAKAEKLVMLRPATKTSLASVSFGLPPPPSG